MFVTGHWGTMGTSILLSLLMLDAACFYAVFKLLTSSWKNHDKEQ